MQTRNIESLDGLSQEGRKQMKEQIERVQKEAEKLRAQARRLRRAQNAESRQRKKLLEQLAESGKDLGQNMLQRGNELATSGIALAGGQWKSGQQRAREYGSSLKQGMNKLGDQTTQNLTDWKGETSNQLLSQGQQWSRNASGWSDEATHRLRRQGRNLARGTSDWGDDTAYLMLRQGRNFLQAMADWYEEMLYRLRRQSRKLGRNLGDRKEDAAHQLALQTRYLSRNLADRRDNTSRQIRRQGRKMGRNFVDRRDDAVRQMRKQRDSLGERGGQLLQPARKSGVWSVLSFIAGLLLAGGITYWLIKRGIERSQAQEEESIELDVREPSNEVSYHPNGEVRVSNQGGTIVATRLATSASPTTRFVGVLSSKRYYPIGFHPDVRDLVYFDREEDARTEGFTLAE